jgi:hypothetical protein
MPSGCAEDLDQTVGVVVSAFARALDRVEVFVRVLRARDRGWLADRAEHQVGGDRRRVGVPDVGRDQLGGEASLGENGGERQHGAAARPAVGAVHLTGPIVDRDYERDVAAHVRHRPGDRSATGGVLVALAAKHWAAASLRLVAKALGQSETAEGSKQSRWPGAGAGERTGIPTHRRRAACTDF